MSAEIILKGFSPWLSEANHGKRTCRGYRCIVLKYLRDARGLPDNEDLYRLQDEGLKSLVIELSSKECLTGASRHVRTAWKPWLEYLQFRGFLEFPQGTNSDCNSEYMDDSEDQSAAPAAGSDSGDNDGSGPEDSDIKLTTVSIDDVLIFRKKDDNEDDDELTTTESKTVTPRKTQRDRSYTQTPQKRPVQTVTTAPKQPARAQLDIASLQRQLGRAGLSGDIAADISKIRPFADKVVEYLRIINAAEETRTAVEATAPTTGGLLEAVTVDNGITNWYKDAQVCYQDVDVICQNIEVPPAANQALDGLTSVEQQAATVKEVYDQRAQVALEGMEDVASELCATEAQTLAIVKQHFYVNKDIHLTPPAQLEAKRVKAKELNERKKELQAAFEKATWQQETVENVVQALIARCKELRKELRGLIEAHPAKVEEVRRQAVEALRALKIKVDKRYDDDMRTLQYYLSELQAAGEKLHAEYKYYKDAGIPFRRELKPGISSNEAYIRDLHQARDDKRKRKEEIDRAAAEYNDLLRLPYTPDLSLADGDETMCGASLALLALNADTTVTSAEDRADMDATQEAPRRYSMSGTVQRGLSQVLGFVSPSRPTSE